MHWMRTRVWVGTNYNRMVENSLKEKKELVKCPKCNGNIQNDLISKASKESWSKYANLITLIGLGLPA